jgi:hypothetical protein
MVIWCLVARAGDDKNPPSYAYAAFDAKKYGLKKDVFDKAIKGYVSLLKKGVIKNKRYLTICDMNQSSKVKRFYLIDLEKKKVLMNLRVAHGENSGEEYATKFSNIIESHQSSLGFYITGAPYQGENGNSLKLYGQEIGFNDQAYNRAVVVHGSEYITDAYFKKNKKIGRSWGCPAISSKEINAYIQLTKNGSCFFVYYNDKNYNKKSKLIK